MQISKYVRDAIKGKLSDPRTGFNPRLAAIAEDYGIEPWAVDWSNTSSNFLFGRIAPQPVEESSVLTYPLTTIDVVRAQDTRRVLFATFAGTVTAVIDVHHSWPDQSVIADFASMVDATEDAMVSVLNNVEDQDWPQGMLWAGKVTVQRNPIIAGGYGWLQTETFICQFELIGI